MTYEQFLEYIDISLENEFKYFEHFENLIERDEFEKENTTVPGDYIFKLVSNVDKDNLIEAMSEYFDEILRLIPEDEFDIYSNIENTKRYLVGLISDSSLDEMAEPSDNTTKLVRFIDELERFANWYIKEKKFKISYTLNGEKKDEISSLRDLIYNNVLCNIEGIPIKYDLSNFEEFEVESYYVDLISIQEQLYNDEEE